MNAVITHSEQLPERQNQFIYYLANIMCCMYVYVLYITDKDNMHQDFYRFKWFTFVVREKNA